MDRIRGTTNFRELIDDPNVDIVDICVPTPGHVDLAVEALHPLRERAPRVIEVGLAVDAAEKVVHVRQRAVDHCAYYGKVVKFLAVQAEDGGYISFACRWVPYGTNAAPLRTLY